MNTIFEQMLASYDASTLDIWSNNYFLQLADMIRFV